MKPAIPHLAIRLAMRALWVVAFGAAGLGNNPHLSAATSTNRPPAPSSTDRYLLIVDTSSAMERNAENTRRIVAQLIDSGMAGQARAGDTIGLWTFSEELKTGVFPLQRWTPQTRGKIATAAFEFLAKVRYEKQARFAAVLEPLTSVVDDSERITILIITDGSESVSGTPFDSEINESYRLNRDEQRELRMPFITVLRAKGGEFIGWRVNTPPFRPEFPDFPVEPKAAEPAVEVTESTPEPPTVAKPEPIAEAKAEPQPPVTPSLIVVGETPATPTNPATVVTTPTTVAAVPTSPNSPVPARPEVQPAQVEAISSQPAASTEPTVAPKPAEPPQREPQPAPEPVLTPPSTTASHASKDSPPTGESPSVEPTPAEPPAVLTEPPTEVAAVQTAVATPGESFFNRTNLLIAGGVLLVGAFVVFYLLMRRAARPEEKVSLITRSMDRDEHNP